MKKQMKRMLALACTLTLALQFLPVASADPAPPKYLVASKDTFVLDPLASSGAANATRNYGASASVLAKGSHPTGSNNRISYFEFDIDAVADDFDRAYLVLFCHTGAPAGSNARDHGYMALFDLGHNVTFAEGTGGSSGANGSSDLTWSSQPAHIGPDGVEYTGQGGSSSNKAPVNNFVNSFTVTGDVRCDDFVGIATDESGNQRLSSSFTGSLYIDITENLKAKLDAEAETAAYRLVTELGVGDGATYSFHAREAEVADDLKPHIVFQRSTDAPVPITGITLDQNVLSVPMGESRLLGARITPVTASNKTLNWHSSNEAIAAVSQDGTVTGVATGTATITAAATDGSGLSVACDVTVVPFADEDGYDLWLRYNRITDATYLSAASAALSYLVASDESLEVVDSAVAELKRGLGGLFDASIAEVSGIGASGAIVVGTKASARVQSLIDAPTLAALPREGYIIKTVGTTTVIAGADANGALYGAFKLLELVQCGEAVTGLNVTDAPKIQWRVINQWDNWNRSIERGYAGQSIYKWTTTPTEDDLQRVRDFARANASVGINTIVINNVNAQPEYLHPNNLDKVAVIADIFRAYGIRLALSVLFDSPMQSAAGGPTLTLADPLDSGVIAWWQTKIDQIYDRIPDFAGFLIKADSEGRPGPSQYGRTHADGANMFAKIFAPRGGIVMWRAFVYGAVANSLSSERVNQAYEFFKPWDGLFEENVVLQSKNGAWDFLPREPVAPLFSAMVDTNMGLEIQITQEYTGQSTHLCYLTPMWKYYFDFELKPDEGEPYTAEGTTLAKVLDGTVYGRTNSLVAGVANIGEDTNWTRLELAQANWYAFGKLAWNPEAPEADITDTWIKMTFTHDEEAIQTIGDVLRGSWEIYEAYTSPNALGMTPSSSDHFTPAIASRNNSGTIDIRPTGIGTNRNSTSTGNKSNATVQYSAEVGAKFNNIDTCPEELLFWFHHVPYDRVMKNGKQLIENLYRGALDGPGKVLEMKAEFEGISSAFDGVRMASILNSFDAQYTEAIKWRDEMVTVLNSQSGLGIPGYFVPPCRFSVADTVLSAGYSVAYPVSTKAGAYAVTLHGSGGGTVAVKLGDAEFGTLSMNATSNTVILAKGALDDVLTLTAVTGSVTITAVEISVIGPISIGKTVTASSNETNNPPRNIVDGSVPTAQSTGTRWAASNGTYPQWVKIDLGGVCDISGFYTLWYNYNDRSYLYEIWTNTVDDWTGTGAGIDTGTYTQQVNKISTIVTGASGNPHSVTPHLARYVVVKAVGVSTSSGSASAFTVDVFGTQLSSSRYVVTVHSAEDRTIAGIGYTTAAGLLSDLTAAGDLRAIVVDGEGNPVADHVIVNGSHKVKTTTLAGADVATYALVDFTGLISSAAYSVDYATREIALPDADVSADDFFLGITYDSALYNAYLYDRFGDRIEVGATLIDADTTLRIYDKSDNVKDAYTFDVPQPVIIPVTGVTLNRSAATLTVGETLPLTATVHPEDATDKAVHWSSDNPAVASVENGVVTALAAGTAIITVTSVADTTKTASCEITVVAAEKGPVRASIRTESGGDLDARLEYILSLENMERVMNVRVRFELDGNMLAGNELEILQANFEAVAGDSGILRWTPKDDGIWEGEFLLLYLGSPDGLTSEAAMDVAKLIFTAKQYGAATVTLTGLLVTGLDEDGFGVTMDSEIGEAEATAMVAKVYSKYDLNRDGVIDQRDLAMAQRYYMVEEGDANWAAAQVCDFVEDGKITMLDLVDLFVNFT